MVRATLHVKCVFCNSLVDQFCIISQGSKDNKRKQSQLSDEDLQATGAYFSLGKLKPPTRHFYQRHLCQHIEEMEIHTCVD